MEQNKMVNDPIQLTADDTPDVPEPEGTTEAGGTKPCNGLDEIYGVDKVQVRDLRVMGKDDEEVEKKTVAKYVKEQMATLKDYDHKLFNHIVDGLVTIGWHERGGPPTYRLLDKDEATIKVFRDVEAPAVIKICFSAEPEKAEHIIPEPEMDKVKDV